MSTAHAASVMVTEYVNGRTCRDIGERYGVSAESVRRYVVAAGIKMRSRWERAGGDEAAARAVVADELDLADQKHIRAIAVALSGRGFPFFEIGRTA